MTETSIPSGFMFSQASIQDYIDCPRKFKLHYLDKLSWPAVEIAPITENENHQREGELFHRFVQQHRLGISTEIISRQICTESLRRWWDNYLKSEINKSGWDEYTELSLITQSGSNHLIVKYDLLTIHNGKAIIYDWKTYQKRPRNQWMASRMQTRIYRYAIVQAGHYLNQGESITPDDVEMIYWFAHYPDDAAHFLYTRSQYDRDKQDLTNLIYKISHQSFFPLTKNEKTCVYCAYRSYCNKGITAGKGERIGEVTKFENSDFTDNQT